MTRRKKIIIAILIIIAIFIGIFLWLTLKHTSQKLSSEAIPTPPIAILPGIPIAKVGKETLYQSDLDHEIAAFPPEITQVHGVPKKDYLLNKMVEDSIILQESTNTPEANLSNVYNSPNKDYAARTTLVSELKTQKEAEILSDSPHRKIKIISIWYVNGRVSDVGYENARALAQSKITNLHTLVKSNSITIDQAADQIKKDATLLSIDYNYIGNAVMDMDINAKSDMILTNQAFEDELWQLPVGQVSDVYQVKASADEEFYAFGYMVDSNGATSSTSYEQWLKNAKNAKEVVIY